MGTLAESTSWRCCGDCVNLCKVLEHCLVHIEGAKRWAVSHSPSRDFHTHQCFLSTFLEADISVWWDLPLVRGDKGGEGAPGARLQEATSAPLIQDTVPSRKACSSPDSQTLRDWTGLCRKTGQCVHREKVWRVFCFRNRTRYSVLGNWVPPAHHWQQNSYTQWASESTKRSEEH